VKTALSTTPALDPQTSSLVDRFSAIRSRDRDLYSSVLNSKGAPTDEMMSQMGSLGIENKELSETMAAYDKILAAEYQKQLDSVDACFVRSKLAGLIMLFFALPSCASAWWVVQYKVVRPLDALALRIQDIAEGEGDLTRRVEVDGGNEIDEVGI
jgi:methyl-accepting chemotaxis protein